MSEEPNYTKEFFIYILFKPKTAEKESMNIPRCFIGISPSPLKAYERHIAQAGEHGLLSEWIQKMDKFYKVRPTLKILESLRSTYTRNDKYILCEIWRWVALDSGYEVNKKQSLIRNKADVDMSDKIMRLFVNERLFSLRFGDDPRYFSKRSTHGETHESIQPLFGHSLMTLKKDIITFKERQDREHALQRALDEAGDWKVPKNPTQR